MQIQDLPTSQEHAAEITMGAGIDTIVMNGENPTEIYKALDGKQVGTFFKGK